MHRLAGGTVSPGFCASSDAGGRDRLRSPFLSRPAPSATAARPTSSASSDDTSRPGRASRDTRRDAPAAAGGASSTTAGVAALPRDHLPQLSRGRARREGGADALVAPRLRSTAWPPSRTMRDASRTMSAWQIGRAACRCSRLDALGESRAALPTASAERRIHARDEGFGAHAGGRADRSPATRASARASVGRLHERAAAALHVEHQRVAAFRELLAHHRRGRSAAGSRWCAVTSRSA